jgi:hypothetical protein
LAIAIDDRDARRRARRRLPDQGIQRDKIRHGVSPDFLFSCLLF